jgi:hypothetical protein
MHLLLILLLALFLFGAAPVFPYSRGYGWGTSGFFGVLLVVALVLLILGRL